ncbi:MAG: hypothetical protein E4H43_01585 [Bacteroidia bacterium]|nr:MAG: hypothetical protein E4H43_01585 [Bacteroidia bacterium]
MKKYSNTDNPLKALSEKIRKDYFKGKEPLKRYGDSVSKKTESPGNSRLRRLIFFASFLLAGLRVFAPGVNSFVISGSAGINPFEDLIYATAMVETKGNPMAFNEFENAVGIFQIRQVKIDEYNKRTGNNYALSDMYDPELSEKIFLYFASLAGPYNLEKIAKAWNGSGPMTELYWKRIKEYL